MYTDKLKDLKSRIDKMKTCKYCRKGFKATTSRQLFCCTTHKRKFYYNQQKRQEFVLCKVCGKKMYNLPKKRLYCNECCKNVKKEYQEEYRAKQTVKKTVQNKKTYTYTEIISKIKQMGAKEVMNRTGIGEYMVSNWIRKQYKPSLRQVEILEKALFK